LRVSAGRVGLGEEEDRPSRPPSTATPSWCLVAASPRVRTRDRHETRLTPRASRRRPGGPRRLTRATTDGLWGLWTPKSFRRSCGAIEWARSDGTGYAPPWNDPNRGHDPRRAHGWGALYVETDTKLAHLPAANLPNWAAQRELGRLLLIKRQTSRVPRRRPASGGSGCSRALRIHSNREGHHHRRRVTPGASPPTPPPTNAGAHGRQPCAAAGGGAFVCRYARPAPARPRCRTAGAAVVRRRPVGRSPFVG
jgi:hypothetical protein